MRLCILPHERSSPFAPFKQVSMATRSSANGASAMRLDRTREALQSSAVLQGSASTQYVQGSASAAGVRALGPFLAGTVELKRHLWQFDRSFWTAGSLLFFRSERPAKVAKAD